MLKFAHLQKQEQEQADQNSMQIEEQQKQEQEQQKENNNTNYKNFKANNKNNNNNEDNDEDQEIILQVDTLAKSSDYVSRYYTKYYRQYTNDKGENLDQYAFQHVNRLTLIGLSENHVIRKNNLKISKISYECIYIGDLKDFTKGKKKQGSVQVVHNKKIADIYCENGEVYPVYGVLQGHVIELNENILSNPNWIVERGNNDGHIAICDMHKKKINQFKTDNKFLTEEQYQKQIESQQQEQQEQQQEQQQ